jgi:hypothetical protein
MKWCLALTGNGERRQAPFFYGITDGTSLLFAMARARYHAATNLVGMVSKTDNTLKFNGFVAIFVGELVMVLELEQDQADADRYQATQPQAEGHTLQSE